MDQVDIEMPAQLDPQGYLRRIPLEPHQLTSEITKAADVIVLCHLGVPRILREEWSLTIDGLVKQEKRLDWESLSRFPAIEVESVHECAGNPLQPEVPTRRVSNVVWRGVRLADLLDDCGVSPDAAYVWAEGSDHGSFSGISIPAYVKDLPLGRLTQDVLVATALNGEPLASENGFPARLAVPGFYGTNSVKWLKRLTLASSRADSPFTTVWYNDPILDPSGASCGGKPVWALAPHSVIVSPGPDTIVTPGEPIEIWGWAWSDAPLASVKVTADGGASWIEAALVQRKGHGWRRFALRFPGLAAGGYTLAACATDCLGNMQPREGTRNAWHEVRITGA